MTGAENWKLGHDWRLVRTHRRRRRDSTRQLSRVGVGGVYWALGVCLSVLLTGQCLSHLGRQFNTQHCRSHSQRCTQMQVSPMCAIYRTKSLQIRKNRPQLLTFQNIIVIGLDIGYYSTIDLWGLPCCVRKQEWRKGRKWGKTRNTRKNFGDKFSFYLVNAHILYTTCF